MLLKTTTTTTTTTTHINKEGKAYLTPICRICYRKKTLIGVLFKKSSLKVFFTWSSRCRTYMRFVWSNNSDSKISKLSKCLYNLIRITICLNVYVPDWYSLFFSFWKMGLFEKAIPKEKVFWKGYRTGTWLNNDKNISKHIKKW